MKRLASLVLVVGESCAAPPAPACPACLDSGCGASLTLLVEGAGAAMTVWAEELPGSTAPLLLSSSLEMVELHSEPTVRLDSGRSASSGQIIRRWLSLIVYKLILLMPS